jgi:uncharacterized protein YegL
MSAPSNSTTAGPAKPAKPAKPVSRPAVPVNPQQQVLLALVLDHSLSMTNPCPSDPDDPRSAPTTPIDELRLAPPVFKAECAGDALLKLSLSVATVTFCGTVTHAPFTPIADWQPPALEPGPGTALGEAVNTALDLVVARQTELKGIGIPVRHTFVLAITDGADYSDRPELVGVAAQRVRELEQAGEFSFLPVGIQDADLERLAVFTSRRRPARLKGLKFTDLLRWVSVSAKRASVSQVGTTIVFDDPVNTPANPKGWMATTG